MRLDTRVPIGTRIQISTKKAGGMVGRLGRMFLRTCRAAYSNDQHWLVSGCRGIYHATKVSPTW